MGLFKVLHWRWSPAIGLLVAGLSCPLLIWIAVAALLRNLEGPLVALREVDRVLARSPTVTENDEAYIPPQSTSPGPRRALAGRDSRPDSQATQNEQAPLSLPVLVEEGQMPPPTRVEAPPVALPPAIPPSVELAELISFGVAEPGAVEFDLDPDHPVAGQNPDSTNADAAEMPPPTRVEAPQVAGVQPLPPSVELVKRIADGVSEPGATAFGLDAPPSLAGEVLASAGSDAAEMPPPTWLEAPPVPAPLPISPSARLAELIEQGAVESGETAFEVVAEEPAK